MLTIILNEIVRGIVWAIIAVLVAQFVPATIPLWAAYLKSRS